MFAVDIGWIFYFQAMAGVKNETRNLRGLGTANVPRRSYVEIGDCTELYMRKFDCKSTLGSYTEVASYDPLLENVARQPEKVFVFQVL